MKISEMIDILEAIKAKCGDLDVFYCDPYLKPVLRENVSTQKLCRTPYGYWYSDEVRNGDDPFWACTF